MSVFGNILSKIFHRHQDAPPAPAPAAPQVPSASASTAAAAPAPAPAPAPEPVDVEAVLADMAAKNPQRLEWRTSIVDLMKLLDLDSSLAERKQLAAELNYSGDTNDSASMNIWLHRQVMQKLAETGGKVPDSLKN